MAEIDDNRLAELGKAEALVKMLYNNTETKRDFERLAKKVNPSAITVDDQLQPYVAPLLDKIKELEDFKKSMESNITEYSKEQQIAVLRKSGYTADGIKAIEEIMEKEGIKRYDIAAAWSDKIRPSAPVAPNGISPSMWNFENDLGDDADDMKLLATNDDAWLDRKTAQIMNDMKNQRGDF